MPSQRARRQRLVSAFVPRRSQRHRESDKPAQVLHSLSPPSRPRKARKTIQQSRSPHRSLCAACESIDWAAVLSPHPPNIRHLNYTTPSFEMKIERMPKDVVCPMCELVVQTRQPHATAETKEICTFSAVKLFSSDFHLAMQSKFGFGVDIDCATVLLVKGIESRQNAVLGVLHSDSSHRIFSPRLIDATSVDYGLIKSWLNACSNHRPEETCSTIRKKNLPGFKVIDCQTGHVVKAPEGCEYVALSYVWGRTEISRKSCTETRFPATIRDSISVSHALGFQYLWVDRYCIDQGTDDEKHAQISKMDRIYSEASLTIIAAAGEDPTYGLPGVSATTRKPQRHAQIGEYTVVEIFPYTNIVLQDSAWGSRAWTYQEGFLSKRRLIFDDRQVAFVCGKAYYAESFTHALHHARLAGDFGFESLFANAKNDQSDGALRARISSCIEAYSRRRLTFTEDALRACLGIFHSAEADHLWGTLVTRSFRGCKPGLWLNWYLTRPAARRDDFPSWTWVGWDGPIRNCEPNIFESMIGIDVLGEGIDMPLNKYLQSSGRLEHAGTTRAPRLLRLTSSITPLILFDKAPLLLRKSTIAPEDGIYALLPISEKAFQILRIYLDCASSRVKDLEDCIALLFHQRRFAYEFVPSVQFLLLKPTGKVLHRPRRWDREIYTRFGIAISEIPGYENKKDDLICDKSGSKKIRLDNESPKMRELLKGNPLWLENATPSKVVVE